MKKTIVLTALLLVGSLTAVWSQTMTKQQALDEIARIEMIPEMLKSAWEVGRTRTETVINTPKGKVTIKFNLAEIIQSTNTGDNLIFYLSYHIGQMGGNELLLNTSSWAFKNNDQLQIKQTIAHELGHHIADNANIAPSDQYRTVNDLSEINADAFAMRYMGITDSIAALKGGSASQAYIDAVINRAEEMEREEIEKLARLRNIAGLPPQPQSPQLRRQMQDAINAMQYFERAKAMLESAKAEKNDEKKIIGYTEVIRLYPNYLDTYIERGKLYRWKDINKAIADFDQALRIDQNYARAYEARADAYYSVKDYYKVITDCTEAIRLDPKLVYAYQYRASSYLIIGDYDKAIADSTEAIRLQWVSDWKSSPLTTRAEAYLKKGDYDKAFADLTEAVRYNHDNHIAYNLRAELYIAKKDYINAIADYTAVIWIRSQYPGERDSAITKRASAYNAYMAKKDYNKAIADFTELIWLKPEYTDFYCYRAEAYFGKRMYKEARADVDVALQRRSWNNDLANRINAELKKKKF
jgi:tetratricopeptide (TPR) repeat protein